MSSKEQYDSDQSTCSEEFRGENKESEEVDDHLEINTEESEVPDDFQDSSEYSDDNSVIKQDSGDKAEDSCIEFESSEDEEPPRRRARHEQQVEQSEAEVFVGRSERRWTTQEPPKRKLPLANIVRQLNGIARQATTIQTIKETFQLMMTPNMINITVTETNRYDNLVIEQWNEKNPERKKQWKETDFEEILAFIGLLLLGGVHRSKNESLNDLWSMVNGRPIFRATMAKLRFKTLLQFCRFDNKKTRDQRSKHDKLATIRDLWTVFLVQLKSCYIPGASLTVDEQLIPTRG